MDMPKYSLSASQVILVEAESSSRRAYLEEWLDEAKNSGATTWLLTCDRNLGGPWAGLNDWLSSLIPQMQRLAPDLICEHDYELFNVLPAWRGVILIRYPILADIAPSEEKALNHPGDRVFRILHGLINLLTDWYQRDHSSAWVIVCDDFNRAGHLVHRFFAELMRRRGQQLNLTLLIATDPGCGEIIAKQFEPQYQIQPVQLLLPSQPSTSGQQNVAQLLQNLVQQTEQDAIKLEIHLPQLIHYSLLSNQPEKALQYQLKALSIYTEQGLYEDAANYGESALALLNQNCQKDNELWFIYAKLSTCYVNLGKYQQCLQLMTEATVKIVEPEYLFHCYYRMAMLYTRYLPERDLVKAEAYLEKGLTQLQRANLSEHLKMFHVAFNRNGLALIRLRQGQAQKAIELCRSCYQRINDHFAPNQHLLQRAVLVHNIAQVYASLGIYEQAIAYFSSAIAIDSNYSEYYNDRGNIYLKMGRWEAAISDYFKAIELSPPYSEVWTNLGQCYRQMGQMTAAIHVYSTALDLNPNQDLALIGRAQAYESLEQFEAALADYSAALILNPNQPLLLANCAVLNYSSGHYQEALSNLNQAIALSPTNPDLYQNRAVVLAAMSSLNDAIYDLQTYLRLIPNAENYAEVENHLSNLQARFSVSI
ncbi:tetratricopeptide repeat protein [Nostoc sp. FACHB-280]|uniref:tetratricopeptide repeat protein n=1 Tax=Nostoc sp. FACHB-280 TaxID=2692839 RepID=UPI00168B9F42|nr:tetratricopeptide repeat protein [Nostoc sp. FACHB-280]MBD2497923.1 tetratricopeptide repeat protein [Nostoc sp. FACHB-280]